MIRDARIPGGASMASLPAISDELAKWLTENYQPRCWDPSKQADWQHHRYAGMVDLAAYLIACNTQQNANDGLEPDAERAT